MSKPRVTPEEVERRLTQLLGQGHMDRLRSRIVRGMVERMDRQIMAGMTGTAASDGRRSRTAGFPGEIPMTKGRDDTWHANL